MKRVKFHVIKTIIWGDGYIELRSLCGIFRKITAGDVPSSGLCKTCVKIAELEK